MATLYWFSLIVGGGMLAASFLGDLTETDVEDGGGSDAAKILSLRNLTYFLFGFGAAGVGIGWLGAAPAIATLLIAGVVGAAAATAAALLFGYVRGSEAGMREPEGSFVGCAGRVTLPLVSEQGGRVVVQRGPREYELRALPFDSRTEGAPIGAGIVVVEMDGGTALISTIDDPLLASEFES